MSENAVRIALRSMGYENSEMTPHGFQPDVIERHLSHVERNSVRAAYNHAEFLPQRRERMQWRTDMLDHAKLEIENGARRKDDPRMSSAKT